MGQSPKTFMSIAASSSHQNDDPGRPLDTTYRSMVVYRTVCREVHDHTASQPATGPLWIRNYEERGTLRSLGYPPGAITSLVGLTKNGPFTTFLRYTREKT